jgi:hypothetical protein
MDARTNRTWAQQNPRTCCLDLDGAAALRARRLGPRAAFLVAYERLSLLAGIAQRPALAVAAVDPEARVVESLLLDDRRALVIGRHTSAGLRLPADSVALRQIAALACFEGARPVLHLWDLRTGTPFVTQDQQPNGAVVADGPLYAAIAGYSLWFVPVGGPFRFVPAPTGAEAAWQALPECAYIDRRAPLAPAPWAQRQVTMGGDPPYRQASPARPAQPGETGLRPRAAVREGSTSITRMGPPLLMGEGDEPEIGWGTIRLTGPELREQRTVSAERLEQGVLIGRYERCGVTVGTDRVSRVHLLLVRIGLDVWAIDTASTNGVRRGGEILSAGVLGDVDTLALGPITLGWRRIIQPEA